MIAKLGFRDWVQHGYVIARCHRCGGWLAGAEQPNGVWCEASVLVVKTSAIGLSLYAATCDTSVNKGICGRRHAYKCNQCDWTITID